jgi:5-methylcytosine-specific restriction enzyme subunit McrC
VTIPVTNLYYLYCYAWRRFAAIQDKDVFVERAPECITDLWAMVLSQAFERQVRRGLDQGYRSDEGRLSLPRGRIDPVRSTATGALAMAMVECRWNEFVSDTPANRIIKAIMRRLAACTDLDRSLANRLGRLWRGLDQVANVEPTLQSIRSVQLNRHNAAYGLMLDVCALVLQFLVPADGAGEFRFNDPRRDDAHMARVFQDFLTAWFEQHCDPDEFTSIGATKLNWPAEVLGHADDLKHLPAMLTDITMRGPNRVLIVDAKYYHEALISRHENATKKIISNHLYQLHAYLTAWHHDHPNGPRPEGILLYPTVCDPVDINVLIYGFRFRVVTIDLAQQWQDIATDLHAVTVRIPSTSENASIPLQL